MPQEGYYLNDSCFHQSERKFLCESLPREGSMLRYSQRLAQSECTTFNLVTNVTFSAFFQNLLPLQNILILPSVLFLILSTFAVIALYFANLHICGVDFLILLFLQSSINQSTAKDDSFERLLTQFIPLHRPWLPVNRSR